MTLEYSIAATHWWLSAWMSGNNFKPFVYFISLISFNTYFKRHKKQNEVEKVYRIVPTNESRPQVDVQD